MNILKWMWKILPIMLLAVNATACNDDDDSGKREGHFKSKWPS